MRSAKTSSLEEIASQLGELDRTRLDAENEIERLTSVRPSIVVNGSADDLGEHDAALAHLRRVIEQTDARCYALEPELRAADAAAEKARLMVLAENSQTLIAEYERLVRSEYVPQAKKLAASLQKLAEIRGKVLRNAASMNNLFPELSTDAFRDNRPQPQGRPSSTTNIAETVWVDLEGREIRTLLINGRPNVIGARQVTRMREQFERGFTPPALPALPSIVEEARLPGLMASEAPFWDYDYRAPDNTGE